MKADEILQAARVSLAQALTLSCPGDETVALADALGRVLADECLAPRSLPPTDQSAMDGYAVRSAECSASRNRLRIAGRRLAGERASLAVPGQSCVRIMTGAEMVSACDAVVLLEDAERIDEVWVELRGPVAPGQHVRRCGEHVRAGETALLAGRRLRAADVALAAALGLAQLTVRRPLRVGLLSTGTELVDAAMGTRADAICDSNRPMLRAALRSPAFRVFDLGICPDEPDELTRRIERAREHALDLVLCSGGAAQGDADLLRQLPDAQFLDIPIRPGRGLLLAQTGAGQPGPPLISLPGNAVAAYTLMHLVVRPWLYGVLGDLRGAPTLIELPLAHAHRAKAGRLQALRGRWHRSETGVAVSLMAEQGSAMVRTLAEADLLVFVGSRPDYEAGAAVPCVLMDSLEGA